MGWRRQEKGGGGELEGGGEGEREGGGGREGKRGGRGEERESEGGGGVVGVSVLCWPSDLNCGPDADQDVEVSAQVECSTNQPGDGERDEQGADQDGERAFPGGEHLVEGESQPEDHDRALEDLFPGERQPG